MLVALNATGVKRHAPWTAWDREVMEDLEVVGVVAAAEEAVEEAEVVGAVAVVVVEAEVGVVEAAQTEGMFPQNLSHSL